ncbi:MAG: Cellulophaga phage phi10:1 [Bacteroidota bacterium]|jgi:HK97 gp10 family phage protein
MEIKGVNTVIANLRKYGKEAEKDIEGVTELVARNIEKNAKSSAPANFGKLGQSIQAVKENPLNWKVEAGGVIAPYAPFVEFGTGGLVQVPNELKEIAIKFKGKGIKQINLPARPFLYPALLRGRTEYLDKLKKVLDKYGKSK